MASTVKGTSKEPVAEVAPHASDMLLYRFWEDSSSENSWYTRPYSSTSSSTAEPFAITRTRRSIEAGESTMGVKADVPERLVNVKHKRIVLPSSQPAWSARLNLIRRTPEGFHEEALLGWNVAALRAVT